MFRFHGWFEVNYLISTAALYDKMLLYYLREHRVNICYIMVGKHFNGELSCVLQVC